MKVNLKQKKGITLIALVVTIVVLLILAGISIRTVFSDDGVISKSRDAKTNTEYATLEDRVDLAIADAKSKNINPTIDNIITELINEGVITDATQVNTETGEITTNDPSYKITGKLDQYIVKKVDLSTITGYETTNTETTDKLDNKVVVPAGFKVVNPDDTVEDGIIIEDVNHGDTAGSQFVWIPVGNITKEDGSTVNINLDRYTFDESTGIEHGQGDNTIKEYYGEDDCQETTSSSGNTVAKNIGTFKSKVEVSKGFYIARYEARDGNVTEARTNSSNDGNQLVITNDNFVYNFVTQTQAADLSRNMYSDGNFTSDLVNSYAWDTALSFIQKCSNVDNYSQQISSNMGTFAEKGTNSDSICNIYDMASNCQEWSTETCLNDAYPAIIRGGAYLDNEQYFASTRYTNSYSFSEEFYSFRPILYL